MTAMPHDEFAKHVLAQANPQASFQPVVDYDPDGDCVEFITRPDSFYAERVDELVTVYYSHTSGEIIGSLIKNVSRFCNQIKESLPGFVVEIRDGRVKLNHLFLAKMWATSCPNDVVVITYRKLAEVADETGAEANICSS